MTRKESGIRIIDLYCGAGGFSEGFRQAGFDVVIGIDNWKPACDTHEINDLGESRDINLLEFGVDDILALKKQLEAKYGEIDVIIGSPPCTEFSYAKNGGKGDVEKGMLLVRKYLLFVALFKPKYWLMENVPRLEKVLDKECGGSKKEGWIIPYKKLDIPINRLRELGLKGDSLRIRNSTLLTASDFGACQNRKRFIAGKFPVELLEDLKVDPNTDVRLGGLLERLKANINPSVDACLGGLLERLKGILRASHEEGIVEDPNYPGHKIKRSELRDYDYDTSLHPMYWEEMRHLKRRHIQYGQMHFPEDMESPARTTVATFNSSSREALVFDKDITTKYHGKERPVFRQPTVREVACIQGFPISFQFIAPRIGDRYRLVGNAVPCQMAYTLAKAISQDIKSRIPGRYDKKFLTRARVTLGRQRANDRRPLIFPPKIVRSEAIDIVGVHKEFRAKFTKHVRRKMLSSKLEKESCVVIFENTDFINGKVTGGTVWKSCIQKGIGKNYHKIYLDKSSVIGILHLLSSVPNMIELKALLRHLLRKSEDGVPNLSSDWVEFPGWANSPESYLSFVTTGHLKIPKVTMLQKTFTSDAKDIGDITSPIDFFDGMDAIILSAFNEDKFKHLCKTMIHVHSLKDDGGYLHRIDPRIIPKLRDAQVPLVTLMAGLLSVYVLNEMHKDDEASSTKGYPSSLKTAVDKIAKWCEPSR